MGSSRNILSNAGQTAKSEESSSAIALRFQTQGSHHSGNSSGLGGKFVEGVGASPDGSVPTQGVVPGGYDVVSGEATVLVAGGHRAAMPSETGPGPVGQTIVCAPGAVGVVCPPQRAPGKRRVSRILFLIGIAFVMHVRLRLGLFALCGPAAPGVAIRLE